MERNAALVTGASGDLGAAIAAALASDGYAVALQYKTRPERAEVAARAIEDAGGAAFAHRADLSDPAQAKALVETVVARFERLDVLVNAAGGNRDVLLMLMRDEDIDEVLDANLASALRVTRAAIRPMIDRRAGCIVNVASVSAWVGVPGQTNYAAAKAGLIGFTRALAVELGKFNIRVNAVAPGAVESEAIRALPEERRRRILEGIPLGRLGRAEEVAKAVSFFCSEGASYVTGQVLAVSGGLG